jgi:hypothetical protein
MTTVSAADQAMVESEMRSRDFDFGVGDDIDNALQQLRAKIANGIRQEARVNRVATHGERLAYEMAARIAETAG